MQSDWHKPSTLLLVWPEPYRPELADTYRSILKYVPSSVNVSLIVKTKDKEKKAESLLLKHDIKSKVNFIEVPSVRDIWIRDWGAIPAVDSSGQKILLKTIYRPKYLYKKEADPDDRAGRVLAEKLGFPVKEVPLIWDGGNLTHNGAGTAIVTERLLTDNKKNYNENEIRSIVNELIGINNLIVVPEEPGDETGHIDGVARFIAENTIAVAEYPDTYPEGIKYLETVIDKIKAGFSPSARIVRVPCDAPEDDMLEGIPSAVGNHINYLRLGDKILVPGYGSASDNEALSAIKQFKPEADVIIVPDLNLLAKRGGILNCISSVLY